MKKQISITIEDDILDYIDDLCEINGRSRSNMIEVLVKEYKLRDERTERA